MAEQWNGGTANGRMADWRNGGIGRAIDSGGMAEWPERLPTYFIYGTPDTDDATLIIYSIDRD